MEREVATTPNPRTRNPLTMPSPSPCEAPVTIATFLISDTVNFFRAWLTLLMYGAVGSPKIRYLQSMADQKRTELDWQDVRIFVALARHGSLSAAVDFP